MRTIKEIAAEHIRNCNLCDDNNPDPYREWKMSYDCTIKVIQTVLEEHEKAIKRIGWSRL